MIVWDCGTYSPDEDGTWFHDREQAQRQVREGLEKGKLSIQLRGEKLKGSFALVRTKEAKQWLLIKHKDRFVTKDDITARDRSVLSGVTVADMKVVPAHRIPAAQLVPALRTGSVQPMPTKLAPMLAEIGEAPFHRDGWMWEPKLDGYRVIAFIDRDGVRLRSRRGLDLTPAFPALVKELGRAGGGRHGARRRDRRLRRERQAVVQCAAEPGATEDRRRSWPPPTAMRPWCSSASTCRTSPASTCAKRRTATGGAIWRRRCCRRRWCSSCMPTRTASRCSSAALASGFEGVVGKRLDSRYHAGRRSPSWLKVKPVQSAEFVIGGYTRGKGARESLGAILVGYWEDGQLRHASHVGSGFDARTLERLQARLAPLKRRSCPFAEKPELNNPTTWVEPELVAEVQFQEWTGDGHLRAPVFLRLRDDIDAKTVRRVAQAKPIRVAIPAKAGIQRLESRKGTGCSACAEDGAEPTFAGMTKGRGASQRRPPAKSTTSSRSSRTRSTPSSSPPARTASASRTSTASTGRPTRRCNSRR